MISLQQHLTQRRDSGKKLLIPYVTGGVRDDWLDILHACERAGADAIEVGFPFSDPVMDGPIIQAASMQALERGVTPASLFEELSNTSLGIPLAVMTYVNLVYKHGYEAFAGDMVRAGISGAILPDLPKEESAEWFAAAQSHGVEPVLLAAPNTSDERLASIAAQSRGFLYAIGMLGVTGVRDRLADSARQIGSRLKAITETPVLIGIGISTPSQAVEAAEAADGVIVGSAVVRRITDGESPEQIGEFVASLRAALD